MPEFRNQIKTFFVLLLRSKFEFYFSIVFIFNCERLVCRAVRRSDNEYIYQAERDMPAIPGLYNVRIDVYMYTNSFLFYFSTFGVFIFISIRFFILYFHGVSYPPLLSYWNGWKFAYALRCAEQQQPSKSKYDARDCYIYRTVVIKSRGIHPCETMTRNRAKFAGMRGHRANKNQWQNFRSCISLFLIFVSWSMFIWRNFPYKLWKATTMSWWKKKF